MADGGADEILTADEVAAWLRVAVYTVRREAAAGRLPARRVGKEWRFSKAAVSEWLNAAEGDERYKRPRDA